MTRCLPAQLVTGDTWKWSQSLCDYSPNQGWGLAYSFRGGSQLDVTGTPNGSGGWDFTVSAGDTAALVPGQYAWQARVELDGETYTAASGVITLKAGLASVTTPFDTRTSAEKQLAAVESALESLLSKQNASVSFGDQSYSLQDVEKLMNVRDRLRTQVAAENGNSRPKQILVTFTRP